MKLLYAFLVLATEIGLRESAKSHMIRVFGDVEYFRSEDGMREYVIKYGDSGAIECHGREESELSGDASNFNSTVGRFPLSCSGKFSSHCTTIRLSETTNLDVGMYSCADSKATERIFLYVTGSPELKTREQFYFHWSGLESKDIILPCRPSHPDIEVRLQAPPGVLTKKRKASFDPRTGFNIARSNSTTDSGIYTCHYSYKNQTSNSLIQVQILHIPQTSEEHLIPLMPQFDVRRQDVRYLINDGVLRIRENEVLNVFCNVTLEHTNELVKIVWTKDGKRIPSLEKKSIDPNGAAYFYSIVKINNTGPALVEGSYACSVTNRIGISNIRRLQVTIINEEDKCHVLLPELFGKYDDRECFPIQVPLGQNANISLIIEEGFHAHSRSIYWVAPNGRTFKTPIPKGPKSKYVFHTPKSHTNNVILEINSVTFEDHGIYKFFCEDFEEYPTKKEDDEGASICLKVTDSPKTKLNDDRSEGTYFLLGSQTELKCLSFGYPRPDRIEWNIHSRDHVITKNAVELHVEKEYLLIAMLPLNVTDILDRAEVTCTGCLGHACSGSDSIILNSVDYKPPLRSAFGPCMLFDNIIPSRCVKISDVRSNQTLYRYLMEPLTIVCASKIQNQTEGMTFDTEFHSNHSYQRIWIRDSLSEKDNGTSLVCGGRTLYLRILTSEPPLPKRDKNNMNNETLEIHPGTNVLMDCSVTGIPLVNVEWFKDGEYLNESKVVGFLSKNRSNLLLHAYEESDIGKYECIAANIAGWYSGFTVIQYKGVIRTLGRDGVTLTLMIIAVISFFIFIVFSIFFVICCRRYQIVKDELSKAEIELFLKGDLPSYDLSGSKTEDLIDLLPYDESIEFPRDRLKLCYQIGSGAFGRVILGEAVGIISNESLTKVAVKMCKPPVSKSQLTSLMSEIKIMLHLGKHLNVVNLLGACTTDLSKRELWVIVEYCRYGNLQQYLLKHRKSILCLRSPVPANPRIKRSQGYPENELIYASLLNGHDSYYDSRNDEEHETTFNSVQISTKSNDAYFEGVNNNTDMTSIGCSTSYQPFSELGQDDEDYDGRNASPTLKDLLSWSYQITKGMQYLMQKNVIHGDLAARNVLLGDYNIVKICDFGLARNTYSIYRKSGNGGLLPVKWMALESLTHGIFSSRSDVWSFGILLWEIFSLGRNPYPGVEPDENFRRRLESGYRMKCPDLAPPEIQRVMTDCWQGEPELRPDFTELSEKIGEKIHETEKKHYLNLNKDYSKENQERELKYAKLLSRSSSMYKSGKYMI